MTQGQWWRASSWREGGPSGSSPPTSNSRSGDTRVPEDELKNASTEIWRYKDLSFSLSASHQASVLTVPYPVAAARCPFQSLSSNTLMPTSVTPRHSVNFNTVTVLSLGISSGHSAPSRPLCFRISTRWSGVSSCSWEFSNSKTSSASYIQTFALRLICRVLKKRIYAERRKSGRLAYSGESAGLRWPPSPYQFSICIVLLSESDCNSTTNIRITVGAKLTGMRTVKLRIITIKRNDHKPMDLRTIINLLLSAMWEIKRKRARKKGKRNEQLHLCVCVCVFVCMFTHLYYNISYWSREYTVRNINYFWGHIHVRHDMLTC